MSKSKQTAEMGQRLEALANEAQAIMVKAQGEKRELTSSEKDRIARVYEEFNATENEMAQLRTGEMLSAPQPRLTEPGDVPSSTFRASAYAGTTSSTYAPGAYRIGAHADTVKATAQFVRTGVRSFQNAMSIGTAADGGYEVPTQLDRDLQTVAANYSPLLRLAKVVENATDGYVQNVATNLPASAWVAEGGTRAVTNSPTIAQITFQRGAVYAVVQASQWVMQDAEHDLYNFLVSELGRQFGAAIGAAIINGAAAQPAPKGITAMTTAATADGARAFGTLEHIVTGGATTAPTLDHCITLMSKMHPQYLDGASWLMSPTAAASLMTQKASTGGSYLWQPDLSASQPPTLFGKPVYIDPNLPAPTTGNALSVWLGNWSRAYSVVRYNRPIMIRDDVTTKGQVLIYSEQRFGGNMTDSSALKAIKTSV